MRNICFAAALLFCIQVYGAKAESMDSQTTYLNYKVATSNGQGSRRCPANLAFLPSTWIGVLFGALTGARLLKRLNVSVLRQIFCIAIVLVAINMIWQGLGGKY